MYSKWNKIALAITVILLVAGLGMGIVSGPNGIGELNGQKLITIDMGAGFIDAHVSAAFEKAGIANVQVSKGGEAESEPKLAFVRVPNATTEVPTAAIDELRELYPNVSAGAIEELSPAANLGGWVLKAVLVTVVFAALILLYGTIRFRWEGALRMLISVMVNIAVTLSLGMICRIPLGFGFLAALGVTAVFSVLQSADWQNSALRLSRERSNWNRERIADEVISSSMARRLISAVTAILFLVVLAAAGMTTTVFGMSVLAIIGVVISALLSITLDGFWWNKIQRA